MRSKSSSKTKRNRHDPVLILKYLTGILLVLFLTPEPVSSQCNQQLVDKAANIAGNEAIFIRDFKVRLPEGTMENPAPVGRFPVFLNEGITYRFTIESDTVSQGFGILQLQRRDRLFGSTFDFDTRINTGQFDFACEESATYQVLISFNEGNPGCAAGVLSMLLQDDMEHIVPETLTSDSAATLYLYINNELHIAATGIPGGHLEVETDNGTIEPTGKMYIAKPDSIGTATIWVDAYRRNGELSERDSLVYRVEYPPLPILHLPGMHGNVLYKNQLTGNNIIRLESYVRGGDNVYTLKEFTLSDQRKRAYGLTHNEIYLTQQQIELIRDTPAGERIILSNIRYADPDGNFHFAGIQEIWIEE